MRRHPVIGYELLKDNSDISPEILNAVRHHHEYLDGSGYPDALTAPEISDLVRLLTISDIFAALIESRPYRPVMSRQDACKFLCGMDGKLETIACEGFPECSACGVKQICKSETCIDLKAAPACRRQGCFDDAAAMEQRWWDR